MGSCVIGKFINNKIGGITGDTLGAVNELMETVILLSICVIERTGMWLI
jgi:cobalamin synthase